MKEVIGQYFFRVRWGRFVVASNPFEIVHGQITDRIISKKVMQEAEISFTDGDWDVVWEGYKKDIREKGLDRVRPPSWKTMHTPCNI